MRRMDDVRLKSKERGVSMVEYAILLSMLILLALASVRAISSGVSTRFSNVSDTLTS